MKNLNQQEDKMTEITFVMIKPDAVKKNVIGAIIKRIEDSGLKLVAGKLTNMKESQARELYKEHEGKEFYEGLVEFALSGPVFPMVVQGKDAVKRIRDLIGATNPKKAEPGTIRYDFGRDQELPANIIHASDSPESAAREIPIFFKKEEIVKR